MVSCSRFIWITNSSDHGRVWTANLLHTKSLPNPLGHRVLLVRWIRSTRIRYLTTVVADLCWDTSTLSQVSNCDGVMLEIYLDHRFQWPREVLNCESPSQFETWLKVEVSQLVIVISFLSSKGTTHAYLL